MPLVEQYQRQVENLLRKIETLEGRPKEPALETEPTVIRFDIRFHRGDRVQYSYVGIRVAGVWFLSGQNPTGMRWDDLLDWIGDRLAGDIWQVSQYVVVK